MKVFDCVKPWPTKINFVDVNNLVVGFDGMQDCCENFGYYFSTKPGAPYEDHIDPSAEDLEPFVFDREFFEESGSNATFKLVNGDEVLYLTLYNEHNGYYSHGFDFSDGDKKLRNGYL